MPDMYSRRANPSKVLTIPIWLLWRVRLKPSQKVGLGTFLCLNICMVLMTIMRVSGLRYRGGYDNIWVFLWQQIEACTAVTMLSLTAFRSFFVESRPGPNKAHPWVPSTKRLLARRKKFQFRNQCLDDVNIPSATITGLSRVLHRKEEGQSFDESFTLDRSPLSTRTCHDVYAHV